MTAYERVVEALKDVEMSPVRRHWLEEDLRECVEDTHKVRELEGDIRELEDRLAAVRDAAW